MEFNKEWLAKLSSPESPTTSLVKEILDGFTEGRQSYILAGLLSFENKEADQIVSAYERLKNFDRDDLGEVIEEVVQEKSRAAKAEPRKVPALWGIA